MVTVAPQAGGVPPVIELPTLLPRRIYAPLETIIDGPKASMAADQLFKLGEQPNHQWVLYWRDVTDHGWRHDKIDLRGGRIPRIVWERSVSLWLIANSPNAKDEPLEIDWAKTPYLDLSLGVGDPDRCGLIVTFNPCPYPGSLRPDYLLVTSHAQHEFVPEGISSELQGKTLLAICMPEIALAPIANTQPIPDVPPGDGFLGIVPPWATSKKWRLRPREPFLVSLKPASANPGGCILAVDFGTAASTIAILPAVINQVANAGGSLPEVPLLGALASWTHGSYEPDFGQIITAPGVIPPRVVSEGSSWQLPSSAKTAKPQAAEAVRFPLRQAQRAGWDPKCESLTSRSLIFALPDVGKELVMAQSGDVIGQEAAATLEESLHGGQAAEWDRFLFGAKSLVGDDLRANNHAFHKYRGDHPIELYLRELLNQAIFRCVWNDKISAQPLGPLLKVVFSHPVTWTKDQRKAFMEHFQHALEKSAFAELLPAGGAAGLIRDDHATDEASAAFLGFVLERYSGLNGDELVKMLQPFDPSPVADKNYPKKANVLVFDCGEGTTDVVWLELNDPGGNKAVESTVVRHFAMDRAGLEVTKRLAEQLKHFVAQTNAGLQGTLRTNLKDQGIGQQLMHGQKITVEAHRRRLVFHLFELADKLKVELATGPAAIPWAQILNPNNFAGAKIAAVPPVPRMEQDTLTEIVRDVFAPAHEQVQTWCKEMPRLDILLFSGRSCQLPELRETILSAIPLEKRPYLIDTVDPNQIRLDDLGKGTSGGEKGKTVVCTGLILNHWNTTAIQGKALRCNPIDEHRRTRAIGLMATAIDGAPLPQFAASDNRALLVEADNAKVDSAKALGPIPVRGQQANGFFIGLNFGGVTQANRQVDAVRPLCRVDIQGAQVGAFDELQFFFQQLTATQIRLAGVRIIKQGTPPKDFKMGGQNLQAVLAIGPMSIRVRYDGFDIDNDFRTSGRIHRNLDL